MAAAVRVLACGAADRGDDAVGLRVVERLTPRLPADASVELVGQLSAEHLVGDPPDAVRIVVDCVRGLAPGAILDLPLAELPRLEAVGTITSTHALPVGQAVALAAAIGAVRPGDRFIGIGGASFDEGAPLTPSVATAVAMARQMVADEIRRGASRAAAAR